MKTAPRTLIALSITIVFALILSCSSEKANTVEEFEAALNRHDIQQILSFYDRDVTIVMAGVSQNVDREELQPLAEWDKAVKTRVRFEIKDVSGDTVKCSKIESNEWYSLFGIDSVYFDTWNFIIEEGKITKMITRLTMESAVQMQTAMGKFMQWMQANHAEDLEELMPDGQLKYGTETALRWMNLLREWNQARADDPEA